MRPPDARERSPSTRSAARAAARRTKTAWATATRGTPGCSRWPTAWAATPRARWRRRLALQTLSALFQREAKPRLADPLRFLHDAIIAGHHQLLRYATERALMDTPRTTVVACVLQGNAAYWAHCGDSRLYLVRGDKLVARTRDHSYSELQETLAQVVPHGRPRQPQRALHLPGQPRQAGGRHRRPAGACTPATA